MNYEIKYLSVIIVQMQKELSASKYKNVYEKSTEKEHNLAFDLTLVGCIILPPLPTTPSAINCTLMMIVNVSGML